MRSGVVDEAVEAAVLLDGLVDQVFDVVLARHVALDEVALTGAFLILKMFIDIFGVVSRI